jgi:hypothetical protein
MVEGSSDPPETSGRIVPLELRGTRPAPTLALSARLRACVVPVAAITILFGSTPCAGTARAHDALLPNAPVAADVLIQAGHEGRPDCNVEPARLCNNTGAPDEIGWTPIVADVAMRALRAAGYSVIRVPAHLTGPYRVSEAVFVHFDGSTIPCGSGPSVGYPTGALARFGPHSADAARQWKHLYGALIPFKFQPDNFTSHLRDYYGFHRVAAADASLVIEGSETTCPAQRAWQIRNLQTEGRLIARFLSARLDRRKAVP